MARLHGLQLRYWDVFGKRRCPGPEAIIAVLRAMGTEIGGLDDVEGAIEAKRHSRWLRLAEPVNVYRDGSGCLPLRLPSQHAGALLEGEILTEEGALRRWEVRLGDLASYASGRAGGRGFLVKHVPLPPDLPLGYHRCSLEFGGLRAESLIVSAPRMAHTRQMPGGPRGWGVFLPLYALRADDDWGVGEYRSLAALAHNVADRGGDTVATLPLLPTDSAALSGPSPYSPVSRLFWSELFIDLSAVPEARQCASWEHRVASDEAQRRLGELREADLVEYAEVSALKQSLLREAATSFFSDGVGERRARLESFLEQRPEVDVYARFRAALERHGRPWSAWPARMRDGDLRDGDFDEAAHRAHLFGQWVAHEQLDEAARDMHRRQVSLYLDLPLGVPHDSFDVWRYRDRFAEGVAAGAPPDTFFMHGQNWALPPLHPDRTRVHGHDYLRASLRHHLRVAGALRIDHVMALHRLFWVPDGFPSTEGVYVRYPARELWAIVALESHRNRAVIVGEDLGTVPPAVRRAMREHGARRIYVLQTEIDERRLPCLDPPAPDSIACMNTHDMPTFAAFRDGEDLRDLGSLGFLDDDTVAAESGARATKLRVLAEFLRHGDWLEHADMDDGDTARLLRAALRFLADSDAEDMVVNLEDLWLEQRPQNVPGTSRERPNWRGRARYTLDEMMRVPEVVEALDEINRRRARGDTIRS